MSEENRTGADGLTQELATEMLTAKFACAGAKRSLAAGKRLNSAQLMLRAAESGIPCDWVEKVRGGLLKSSAEAAEVEVARLKPALSEAQTEAEYVLCEMALATAAASADEIARQIKQLSRPVGGGSAGDVTEEMKRVARAYPITEFIEFDSKRRAICPFHEEKTPSMHFYPTEDGGGRATCFGACHKTYNSIDYVMIKRGYNFLDAVRFLNGMPVMGNADGRPSGAPGR